MNITDLTNDDGLLVRSFQIRATDPAKREFTGIGVPYGETFDSGYGWKERFEPGAVDPADGAKIFWQHREVIGVAIAQRDTDAGHEITGKISDTVLGRDAWTLLSDGAVDSLSIGFYPKEYRVEKDEADGSETIVHTKVRTREFSITDAPAYTTAKVSALRSAAEKKEAPVPTETEAPVTRADFAPVADSVAEMERSIAVLSAGAAAPAGPSIPTYRSIGAFVQAVANGDEAATDFHRDFAGGVFADGINNIAGAGWLGEYFHMVEKRRRIFNTFGKKPLPPKGMKVEFGKIESTDIKMGEQLKEGDDLPGPSKIKLGTDSATVHTVGGWTELSFQAIQRSEVTVLDTLYKGMLMRYGRETEVRVAKEYMALIAANLAKPAGDDGALRLDVATADSFDWLDLMLDAALVYEERGFALEGMHASIDQFKLLNRLTDGDGRRLMNVYGTGVNQVGELNLATVDATLGKVSVQLVGDRSTRGVLSFYDSVAIETLESPGAPIQLQDENIINLSKQLSLYGHVAVTTPFPDAILPVATTPAAV